jgi:hypothetical protein
MHSSSDFGVAFMICIPVLILRQGQKALAVVVVPSPSNVKVTGFMWDLFFSRPKFRIHVSLELSKKYGSKRPH